ncbi:MAG: hypothetical protein Kow0075_04850 [Salibacteraceae bacterium]
MDAKQHLFYGLGIICFAVARADGEIQPEERNELREIIEEWTDRYAQDYDITEIIFSILSKSKPGMDEGFEVGMKHIRLGSEYLNEQLKEHFVYLVEDIARAFPPVTGSEQELVSRFRQELSNIK